ncbi:hypothetical protein GGF43_000887 [Coemansia sp. RSA 2618]|nr:hypothetical protein GGF43_000887 [Coemansia sp. RSA 2618]
MNLSFEDELRGYMCSTKRECAVAKDDALAKTPEVNSWRLPEGFEASADPRYAYNKDNGYWLDIDSGTVSYYDEASHVYVPVDTVPDASQFAGVARLVVVESDNFAVGQIAEVDIEYGLDIGRDRPENGEVRHLRIPDIEVSRYHARIYFGIDVEKHNTVVKDPNHDAGSEDGEIEDTGASDLSEGECEEDNSVSRQ